MDEDNDSLSIECPCCKATHRYLSSHLPGHSSAAAAITTCSHGARLVFVSVKCPVCLEDAEIVPPMVNLECGHVLCRPCFVGIKGVIWDPPTAQQAEQPQPQPHQREEEEAPEERARAQEKNGDDDSVIDLTSSINEGDGQQQAGFAAEDYEDIFESSESESGGSSDDDWEEEEEEEDDDDDYDDDDLEEDSNDEQELEEGDSNEDAMVQARGGYCGRRHNGNRNRHRGRTRKKWSKENVREFLKAMARYETDWERVAAHMGSANFSAVQCSKKASDLIWRRFPEATRQADKERFLRLLREGRNPPLPPPRRLTANT